MIAAACLLACALLSSRANLAWRDALEGDFAVLDVRVQQRLYADQRAWAEHVALAEGVKRARWLAAARWYLAAAAAAAACVWALGGLR